VTCQLYRYYDAQGCLLYVGISFNSAARASQHKAQSSWYSQAATITIENCKDRQTAARKERQAIKIEKPIFNCVHNRYNFDDAQNSRIPLNFHDQLRRSHAAAVAEIAHKHSQKEAALRAKAEAEIQKERNRLESEIRSERIRIEAEHRYAKDRLRRLCAAAEALQGRIVTQEHVLWQMYSASRPARPATRSTIRRALDYVRAMVNRQGEGAT
jgi:predicted GIY-YIG superfamily endonuclease